MKTDNIIDAQEIFLGQKIITALENMLTDSDKHLVPMYEIAEDEGTDYLELMLYDINDGSRIVIDRAPTLVFQQRYENHEPLFSLK